MLNKLRNKYLGDFCVSENFHSGRRQFFLYGFYSYRHFQQLHYHRCRLHNALNLFCFWCSLNSRTWFFPRDLGIFPLSWIHRHLCWFFAFHCVWKNLQFWSKIFVRVKILLVNIFNFLIIGVWGFTPGCVPYWNRRCDVILLSSSRVDRNLNQTC